MRKIFEDILDDITADDLEQRRSTAARIVDKDETDRYNIAEVPESEIRKNFTNAFCYSISYRVPKEDCQKLLEKIVEIFDTYSNIKNYKLCYITNKTSQGAYDDINGNKGFVFDIAFNIEPGRLVPFFERFVLPLMSLLYPFQKKYDAKLHFYTIDYFNNGTNYQTVYDASIRYIAAARTGKMGVHTDKLSYGFVLQFIRIVRPFAANQATKYQAFYLFLLFSIFKTDWKNQFKTLDAEGNMKVFNVELMMYSHKDHRWYYNCIFKVQAQDSVTMALKLLLFAAFTKITKTSFIQYNLEKNNHGKKVIPMSDQFFKKWYNVQNTDYKKRYSMFLGLTDGTKYYDIVNWMFYHASTPDNCASGAEIIEKLNELAEMPDKFRI